MNIKNIKKNKEDISKIKNSERDKIYLDESVQTNKEDSSSESEKPKKEKRIEYSFNIFDIIVIMLFKCCMTKKLSIKNDIYEKASDVLLKKLDVITYMRNMILFDIINQIIIVDN